MVLNPLSPPSGCARAGLRDPQAPFPSVQEGSEHPSPGCHSPAGDEGIMEWVGLDGVLNPMDMKIHCPNLPQALPNLALNN